MRRDHRDVLTRKGALKKKFRPSIYFESSVIVDYWSAEGLESQLDAPKETPPSARKRTRSSVHYFDTMNNYEKDGDGATRGLHGLVEA